MTTTAQIAAGELMKRYIIQLLESACYWNQGDGWIRDRTRATIYAFHDGERPCRALRTAWPGATLVPLYIQAVKFEMKQLGPDFAPGSGYAPGHWIVLKGVFIVAASETYEAAEAALRLLAGPENRMKVIHDKQ